MFKKFIDGLVFGAGFGIAFVVVWMVAFYLLLPIIAESGLARVSTSAGVDAVPEKNVHAVPSIDTPGRYLGSTNISSSDFSRSGVLAGGPGKIIGSAQVNGAPVTGLKLRLALNGSVYSQWATTDSTGQYNVDVPYGDYIIDGFELDRPTADKYLTNKIRHPQSPHSSTAFTVSESSGGRGLSFRFVDPVIKKIKSNKFKKGEEIILEWEQYPGAATYSVQIFEKTDPYTWSNNTLFKWSEKPELFEASINLNDFEINPTPDKYYTLDISAYNEQHEIISKSPTKHSGYDFEISR